MTTANAKLINAYNHAVNAGRVLDVSELNLDGTGSRTVKVPATARGTRRWVQNLPVISNNYETYSLAMELLGPDFRPFANQYLALFGTTKIVRTPRVVKSPRVTVMATPIVVTTPGVTIKRVKTPKVQTPKGTAMLPVTIHRPRSPTRSPPRIATVTVINAPMAVSPKSPRRGRKIAGPITPHVPMSPRMLPTT